MTIDLPPAIELMVTDVGGYVFRDESILGTRMQLQLVSSSASAARAAAIMIRAEIDRLDRILSGYRSDSELSALNRSCEHIASPELFAVIAAAEHWRELSNGAFSGRLGRVINLWRVAGDRLPDRNTLAILAKAAANSVVRLDAATRTIVRPEVVQFALDAYAKSWIVDRAFDLAMSATRIAGALINIGGDIRCGGKAPGSQGWCVGVTDPHLPQDNSPAVAIVRLSDLAIATSGRGPRDLRVDGKLRSATLSPHDGWPASHHISVTTIATTAADADALATALLVLPTAAALSLAESHATAARFIATHDESEDTRLVQSTAASSYFSELEDRADDKVGAKQDDTRRAVGWHDGWQALATFTAPRRQLLRDPDFRSPYMAMWITDQDNRPVRTLIVIGKRREWQKDNFIWWSINRAATEALGSTRSMSTSGAGVYNVFWDGQDDSGRRVAAGRYVLHVETSRERGQHTYRSLTLDFTGASRFVNELAPTEEGGALRVSFDHY